MLYCSTPENVYAMSSGKLDRFIALSFSVVRVRLLNSCARAIGERLCLREAHSNARARFSASVVVIGTPARHLGKLDREM
jgi:hypothetical protein